MQYKKKEAVQEFKPFSIELVFETKREVEIWKRFIGNLSQHNIAEMCNSRDDHDGYAEFNSDETKVIANLYSHIPA